MRHPMAYIIPIIFVSLFWLGMTPVPARMPTHSASFDTLAHEYTDAYLGLDVPPLTVSWADNMSAEFKAAPKLDAQKKFFTDMQARLAMVEPQHLNACQTINHQILRYETRLNLARLPIAQAYVDNPPTSQSDLGYASFPQGQDWYDWYLQKWLSTNITPNEIMAFGQREVSKALAELAKLEADIIASGTAKNIAEFIKTKSTRYDNETSILAAFKDRQSRIEQNLDKLFVAYDIAPIGIKPNTNPAMARAPGYYTPPDFYYGWDGASYRAQDTDYLYLHEGVPGHHFQFQIADKYKSCTFIMPQIFYSTFAEGWAAYVETLGAELGVYDSFETRLGAIDWNLIRSARTYLDVAINHRGWSNAQAHTYWRENLPAHLADLAAREIKRMRDWPAQVITYKVGADAILRLKASEQKRLGKDFDIRKFHDTLLRIGPIPIEILDDAYTALDAALDGVSHD